jgi:glycine hydroxymethyltransferase
MAVHLGLLQPGDTILGLSLDHGGHLTHGSPVNASGILYDFVSYKLSPSDERIDLDQVRDLALAHRPKMIVAGATAYPRRIDAEPFRAIADEVGALLMFDIAHIAGLIAGGAHPSPVGIADVVTLTTHKTLRGPRGGAILTTAELGPRIDKAIFPGLQGGPLEHVIAGRRWPSGRPCPSSSAYAVRSRQRGAGGPSPARLPAGLRRHRQPPDAGRPARLRRRLTGKEAQAVLDQAGITLNKNTIPDDPRSPFVTSGVRIGTPSVTTQGMKEPEMVAIAELIARALRDRGNPAELAAVREDVGVLCGKFTPYAA